MRLGMCSKVVAPHGAQVPVALKSALFVNCSSPNLPVTAPPLARPFSPFEYYTQPRSQIIDARNY